MAIIRKLESKEAQEMRDRPRALPPKKNHREHDDSNWLISYADMMTLLCIFYIMLFSMSKINTPEFEKVKKEVSEQFGAKYHSPTEELGRFVNNILVENGIAKDATMTSDGVSVSVAFHSTLFFDTASAEISGPGRQILDKMIAGLSTDQKKTGKNYKIVIEGHTDSQPVLSGPYPSNWELSSSRATRVIRVFLEQGFAPENLLAIGYADTQPLAESRNPDGTWNEANLAKNRRVILRVLMPDVDTIPWSRQPAKVAQPEVAAATTANTPVANTPVTNVPVAIVPVASPAEAPVVAPERVPAAAVIPTTEVPVAAPVAPVTPAKP